MGVFKTTRTFPYSPPDLAAVAEEVMGIFRSEEFEATGGTMPGDGHYISLTKGDTFQAVVGLKSALNVRMRPVSEGTEVVAEIGEYGAAFVGAVGSLIFWPLAIPVIAGAVRSSKLDERAMQEIEKALQNHSDGVVASATAGGTSALAGAATGNAASAGASTGPEAAAGDSDTKLCPRCGATLPAGAKFCFQCGTPVGG